MLVRKMQEKTNVVSELISYIDSRILWDHVYTDYPISTYSSWRLTTLPESIFLLGRRLTSRHLRVPRSSRLRAIDLVRLLTSSLLSLLYISPAGTATAKSSLHQPGKDGKRTSHPHERKQSLAYFGANVQFCHRTNSITEDDEHDGCDDGRGSDQEGIEKGEDGDGEGEPAREDGQRHEEDEDEGKAGAGEEEAEHPLRGEFDKVEDIINIGRKVDLNGSVS